MSIYKGIYTKIARRVDIPVITAIATIFAMGVVVASNFIKSVVIRTSGLFITIDEAQAKLEILCPRPVEEKIQVTASHNIYDISIIIPVFNAQNFLKATIDSVLSQQTGYCYQIICINDGSSDASEAILSDYAKDQRVLVLSQKNAGIAAARNRGLENAKSDAVMFLDADDILLPDAIELMMSEFMASGSDIVVANFIPFSKEVTLDKPLVVTETFQRLSTEDGWLTVKDGFPWGKVFRKQLWQNIRFPEGCQFEDTIIKGLVFRIAIQISYTQKPVLGYRQHGASITQKLQQQPYSVIYVLWVVERIVKRNLELGLTEDHCFSLFMQSHLTKILVMRTKYLDSNTLELIFFYCRGIINGHNLPVIGNSAESRAFKALTDGRFKAWYFWSSLAILEP